MAKGDRQGMNDRPLTLVLIAVAILVALYIRRLRPSGTAFKRTFDEAGNPTGMERAPLSEIMSPDMMRREGEVRGIKVNMSQPLTREQFERLMGPVSVK